MPSSLFYQPANRSRRSLTLAALVLASTAACAQETYATLIENESSATVEAAPTEIVFLLTRQFAADSLVDAVRAAQAYAPGLRSALKDAGYERAALRVTGPMIPAPGAKRIRVDAEIRLSLSSGGEEGTRSTAFAAAADAIVAIAEGSESQFEPPRLDVSNRAELEGNAVQRAVENAYARANAAATIMQLNIVSVDRVTIESVTWHDRPDAIGQEASAERIGVTAKIRVAYLAMPHGN